MIWDIIIDKLTAAGLAVPGQTLFLETMPADIGIGVMLRSPLAGIHIDPYLKTFYKPTLQVIVRHDDPVAGDKLANSIKDLLTVESEEKHQATAERGAVRILRFFPREIPIRYPRLDGNGIEWSLNFVTAFSVQPL